METKSSGDHSYMNPKKLEMLERDLTNHIKNESRDYRKIALPLWKRLLVNPFSTPSILSYYQYGKNAYLTDLYEIRRKVALLQEEFRNFRFSYLDLVSLSEDKNLHAFHQIEQTNQQLQGNLFFKDNADSISEGIIAEDRILREHTNLHRTKIQFLESEDALQSAINQSITNNLKALRNRDLLANASRNGILTWKEYASLGKDETEHSSTRYIVPESLNQDSAISQSAVRKERTEEERKREQFKPFPHPIIEAAMNYREGLPSPVKDELDLLASMEIYGRTYSSVHFPQEIPEVEIKLDVEDSPSANSLMVPNTKQNMLGGVEFLKVFMYVITYFGILIGEMSMFQSIYGELSRMDEWKLWCMGFASVGISSLFAFMTYGATKRFVQKHNTMNWRSVKSSRGFYFLFAGLLLFAMSLGCLFFDKMEHRMKVESYTRLEKTINDNRGEMDKHPERISHRDIEKMEHNKEKLQRLDGEINKPSDYKIVGMITTTLSSAFILLVSGLLLNIALLHVKSYSLHRKLEKNRRKISTHYGRFDSKKSTLSTLRHKGHHIVSLIGQRLFIRSIKFDTTKAHFHHYNKKDFPLPLNGKEVHHNSKS